MVTEAARKMCSQRMGNRTESFWMLPDGTMRMIATGGGTPEEVDASERATIQRIMDHKLCLMCFQPTDRDEADICAQCVQRETIIEDLLRSEPWRARLKEMLDTYREP